MSILQPWPEHQNPTRRDRIASAPYNFVPLPEKIISAVDSANELPDHNKYYRNHLSGYFDVTLTTRSPLYIRGPIAAKDLPRQEEKEIKDKPEFFYTHDEHTPVIPGSSLRGMLRSVLEIASYSKMQWVSDKQLFFRTVDDSAIGSYYNYRMVEELDTVHSTGHPPAPAYHARVEVGFFHMRKDRTYFIEECTVARVEIEDLLRLFGRSNRRDLYQLDGRKLNPSNERNPNQTPSWSYQHKEIWADIDRTEKDYFFAGQFTIDHNNRRHMRHPDLYLRFRRANNLAQAQTQGKKAGKLVLTGHMNYKHLAFLFVPNKQLGLPVTTIDVPNDPGEQNSNKRLVDRFHDDDQLTQWQKKAFPAHRRPSGPKEDGYLLDGDPVFFLCDEKRNLIFFGRAQMFRLPYTRSPFKLVDPSLHSIRDIDYAEALFGFVRNPQQFEESRVPVPRQGEKGRAYAGRVTITNAILQPDQESIWLAGNFNQDITPKILATPKPTAFQHYLTQQHPDEKKRLGHYDSKPPESDKTTIRGHKLYWHQGLDAEDRLRLEEIRDAIKEPDKVPPDDKQHTHMKPLKPGVQFSFRVYFENLSEQEIGALCWTRHPNGEQRKRYCHHLGMGKPLGMGSVELHAHLHIIDRPSRYNTLFTSSGHNWQSGEASTVEDLADREVLERRTRPFEKHLLDELNPDPPCGRLADMQRIAMLLKLLEWPGYRAEEGDRYLEAENRPNTRYMKIQPNEYRDRPVLPDPRLFDNQYFEGKSRPQDTHAPVAQQVPAEKDASQPAVSSKLMEIMEEFPIGRELTNMLHFPQNEQGVEVRFWDRNPKQIIGFIPKALIDRPLGDRISVVVTGHHQEPNGRLVVELKLRSKK